MIEPTEEGRKLAADLVNAEPANGGVARMWDALSRAASRLLAMEADMAEIADDLSEWKNGHGRCAKIYAIAAKYRKPKPSLTDRITEYLSAGGMFNPELMEHEKVRDLLIECRTELAKRGIELKERGE